MPSLKDRVPHPRSIRPIPPGIRVGASDPHERLKVTVFVRSRPSSKRLPSAEELGARPLRDRQYFSREEFEAAHGSDPKDIAKIETFAHAQGLEVVETDAARRAVVLSGTVAALGRAFGVEMARYRDPNGVIFRGHTGRVHVTEELVPIVEGVFGFTDRPHAERRSRHTEEKGISYTPPRLAKLYDFPIENWGHGQCIAILEFGGGYRTADIEAYFAHLRIPVPEISSVLVGDGINNPADPNYPKEVTLDIAVAGAIAPRARIVVYFAHPSESGWIEALTRAIHDKIYRPSVISISWGAPETRWSEDVRHHIDRVLQEAAHMGVTVCCASGDTGSAGGLHDHRAHVYFPASNPFVLACGGTRFEWSGDEITHEVVWTGDLGEASSGGFSEIFPRPVWQEDNVKVPPRNHGSFKGRGLPDVAANASHYRVLVDGQQTLVGGTSAATPLWAGLIALINEHLGKPVGYLNPLIYPLLADERVFNDIIIGTNGAFWARDGWDACTGLGSPHGANLLQALRK